MFIIYTSKEKGVVMNKIYKVIWNRVRHCYVVVSEITKNHGKDHSTNLRVSKGLCALTLAIGLSLSSYAFAADGNTTTNQDASSTQVKADLAMMLRLPMMIKET